MDNGLRVGVAKIDITPPVGTMMDGNPRNKGSQGIHDPLYAKALILDDARMNIAIIALDLIGLYRENVDSIRSKIQDQLGINKNRILISCSHTHSGPSTLGLFCELDNAYFSLLEEKIPKAVAEAKANMEMVQLGAGIGKEDTIGHQRRLRMADGTIRMNWEEFSPDEMIGPAGPTDPQVGVIKFQRQNGSPKAILINHTCHPNILAGENYLFTADYPGYAMEMIEKETGAIALFTNGALGNIDIDPLKERGFQGAEKAGKILAEEVLRVITGVQRTTSNNLKFLQGTLNIPLRKISEKELKWAKELTKGFKRSEVALRDGATEEIFADELIRLSKVKEKTINIEIQVISIGDILMVALSGEPFVEIGLQIKKISNFQYTFIIGLANDYVGYIPTEVAFKEGCYTTRPARWSKLIPEAERLIVNKVKELIEKL